MMKHGRHYLPCTNDVIDMLPYQVWKTKCYAKYPGIRACQTVSAVFPKFSLTLQADLFSTETSDFLKQIVFLKSFNSVLYMNHVLGVLCYVIATFNGKRFTYLSIAGELVYSHARLKINIQMYLVYVTREFSKNFLRIIQYIS